LRGTLAAVGFAELLLLILLLLKTSIIIIIIIITITWPHKEICSTQWKEEKYIQNISQKT
jgi:hypothetical protein